MLKKVKEKNPDAIYLASYLLDATSLMHQSRQVDLNPRYFTAAGTGFSTPEFPTADKGSGKDAEYTFSVTQWMPESRWPGSAEFAKKFQARYGSVPAYHAVQAYTALKVMAEAVKKAGKWDGAAIRDALYRQAFGPVRWVEVVQALKARGVTHIIECGPGKVLAGMAKRIAGELVTGSIYDPATLAEVKGILA